MAHKSVLVREILECLAPKPSGVYIDATLGNAGHAIAILEATGPNGFLVGIDKDASILKIAEERLGTFGDRVRIVQGCFSNLKEILTREKIKDVDGIVVDLGVSSLQLDEARRGFSFGKEGPLDMRMDVSQGKTVLERMEQSDEEELTTVLKEYGEERYASRIARGLLEKMKQGCLKTTLDIAEVAVWAYPVKARFGRIHPATRTFLALRIWVNGELEALKRFLDIAPYFLKPGGRLCAISFHSLEDRIVKHAFRHLSRIIKGFEILTKKPIRPSREEILQNPRARSAKLRGLARMI